MESVRSSSFSFRSALTGIGILLLVSLVLSGVAHAQSTANLNGTVTDP